MFDKLIRELEQLDRTTELTVKVEIDDKGYFDRQCPSEECGRAFKIHMEDWKDKVPDEAAFCPICGHRAHSSKWNTEEQAEYFQKAALAHVQGRIGRAIREDTRRFNQRQKPGLITMSLSYRPGTAPIAVPAEAADVLRQDFVCEECACRYSALGAAFYCPACGHNSAAATFDQTLLAARKAVEATKAIDAAIATAFDADTAANTVRQILENAVSSLVSSFEHYAEARFKAQPGTAGIKIRGNAFQNLDRASALFKKIINVGFDDILGSSDYADLALMFQRRHVLTHCNGIVDQQYIDKSGDTAYTVGQRLVIDDEAVLRLADQIRTLAEGLEKHLT